MAKEPAYLRTVKAPRYIEAVAKARRTTKPYTPKPLPTAAMVQEALRLKAMRQALVQPPAQP